MKRCQACKGVPASTALCPFFRQQAARVWDDLTLARDRNLRLSEESITEHIWLDLERSSLPGIRVRLLSKGEEARKGADWEWYFGSRGRWFAARVQAKRIANSEDAYRKLNYKVARTGRRQVDLLIEQAGGTHVPLYTFYNSWEWGPGRERVCRVIGDDGLKLQWGCSVGHANDVRREMSDRGPTHFLKVAPVCWPWQCLVCCVGERPGVALADAVRETFSSTFRGNELPPLLEELPPYVEKLPFLAEYDEWMFDLPVKSIGISGAREQPPLPPPDFNLAGAVILEQVDEPATPTPSP